MHRECSTWLRRVAVRPTRKSHGGRFSLRKSCGLERLCGNLSRMLAKRSMGIRGVSPRSSQACPNPSIAAAIRALLLTRCTAPFRSFAAVSARKDTSTTSVSVGCDLNSIARHGAGRRSTSRFHSPVARTRFARRLVWCASLTRSTIRDRAAWRWSSKRFPPVRARFWSATSVRSGSGRRPLKSQNLHRRSL